MRGPEVASRLLREQVVSFSDARKVLRSKPAYQTIWVYAMRGMKPISAPPRYAGKPKKTWPRVTLEHFKMGGQWHTSVEAYQRFVIRINGGTD